MLAAGAGGAIGVDPQVGVVDLDLHVLDGALDDFIAATLAQKVTGEAVEVEDVD